MFINWTETKYITEMEHVEVAYFLLYNQENILH